LEPLNPDARDRVFKYIASLLSIEVEGAPGRSQEAEREEAAVAAAEEAAEEAPDFETFADLEAAARPGTNAEKALVAAYWLQKCQGQGTFNSYAVQKVLDDVGARIANITNAIDDLKGQKPQLVLQLKKSGRSKQARKTYKVTAPGFARVLEMINRG
jgi:hypothetical protein